MSAWSNMADAIAARLKALTIMNDIEVIVDRQKDIDTEVAIHVGKIGGAVTVMWFGGGIMPSSGSVSPSVFQIRCYGSPILVEGIRVDDIAEAAMMAINGWSPLEDKGASFRFEIARDAELLPDTTYVIYEFAVRGRVLLSEPQFNAPTP